jgi:hypothetical protein
MKRLPWTIGMMTGLLVLTALGGRLHGQRVLRHRFEGRQTSWLKGRADAPFKETAHRLTEETARSGQRSEHIQLEAEHGTFIHYTFNVGQAPINEDLFTSLWIKSNRPGVRLSCRVVLPRERDPADASRPLTVLLPGDHYKLVGRWQLLGIPEPVKRLREQQQLLRANLERDILIDGAYVDQLVLNVYGGPGRIDVWTDDLEIGPVLEPRKPIAQNPPTTPVHQNPTRTEGGAVQLRGKHLLVNGKRYFLRGIRHTGTPLWVLRQAGFNTVWIDENSSDELVDEAVRLGFWLVPSIQSPRLPSTGSPGLLASRQQQFAQTVSRFQRDDAVLCWDLGSNLVAERFTQVSRTARAFRSLDPMRPLSADVWDGYERYTSSIDRIMLGAHRWPLYTGLELRTYRDWLIQRRRLASPGTFFWTWVQTHQPEWFTKQLASPLRTVSAEGKGEGLDAISRLATLGPQPEQIRLLAYTAIGAGYRGLGFWSDKSLADPHAGRDRLLALARLNQELRLLEPILVEAKEPEWINTNDPNFLAVVLRTRKAVLVLPIWMGKGAQFVPGQGANIDLRMTVPQIPRSFQAWEISPGRIRSYPSERIIGGTEVRVRNFGLTGAVLFTADLALVARLQNGQHQMRQLAAQLTHDQAREEFVKVAQVHRALEQAGRTLPDGEALLRKAEGHLARSLAARRNGQHGQAYTEAEVALQTMRTLMRSHWEKAVRFLDTPTASPYAVSFFSLPKHWKFWDRIREQTPGRNLLPDGDFETPPGQVAQGWLLEEIPSLDPVKGEAKREEMRCPSGAQAVRLEIRPRKGERPPLVLERTYLALHSPAVALPPGTPVRISAWVKIPNHLAGSLDGVLIYDSAGGEPLAVRLTRDMRWKRISLYRQVPASGKINMTVALTGMGKVYLDDLRIEPLTPESFSSRQRRPPLSLSGRRQPRSERASQPTSGSPDYATYHYPPGR